MGNFDLELRIMHSEMIEWMVSRVVKGKIFLVLMCQFFIFGRV